MSGWGTFLAAVAGPIAKKVMKSLGLGVVSYAGLSVIGAQIRDMVVSNLNGMAGDIAQIVWLSGFGVFAGIVLSAFMTKIAMGALERIGRVSA